MRTLRITAVAATLLTALWACGTRPEPEPAGELSGNLSEEVTEALPDQPADPAIVTAAPEMARTVFSNEWVAVARVELPPGEVVPPHVAGSRVVYPLTGGELALDDDGMAEVVHAEPGEVLGLQPGRLTISNVGDMPSDFLVVERTPVELPPEPEEIPVPDLAVDMEHHGEVLLDDDNVMVSDLDLGQLEWAPLESDLPYLVVALTPADLDFEGPATDEEETVLLAGEATWQPAGQQAVSNVGDGPTQVVAFAFKK
jgi:hypothetical protein